MPLAAIIVLKILRMQFQDIPHQNRDGLLLANLGPGSANHIESRISPVHQHVDQILSDLFSGKEYFKYGGITEKPGGKRGK